MQPVVAAQRQRRLRERDPPGVGLCVQILVTVLPECLVPPRLVRTDRPEFSTVTRDSHRLRSRKRRVAVTEADAIVEQPEDHADTPVERGIAQQRHREFGMTIADDALLAPRLLPGRVSRGAPGDGQRHEAGVAVTGKTQRQRRRRNHEATISAYGVGRPATLHPDADFEHAPRGRRAFVLCRDCSSRQTARNEQDSCEPCVHERGFSSGDVSPIAASSSAMRRCNGAVSASISASV